jgi:hypothetical protein
MPQRNLTVRPGGDILRIAPPSVDPGPDPLPEPDPAPDPGSGFRRGYFFAALANNLWGTYVWPDADEANGSGNEWVKTGGFIDQARAANGGTKGGTLKTRLIIKITPANHSKFADGTYKLLNSDGSFSETKWMSIFDTWYNGLGGATGIAKFRSAVADGTIDFHYVMDDFFGLGGENSFSKPCTFEQMEAICHHQKVTKNMPWFPCAARAPNTIMKRMAKNANGTYRKYKYLDAGWHDIRMDRDGGPRAYYNLNYNEGKDVDLGSVGGINILNGGTGDDKNWQIHFSSNQKLFAMSPAEIRLCNKECVDNGHFHGMYAWSYSGGVNPPDADVLDYLNSAPIQAALKDAWDYGKVRADANINIRGDLVAA